MTIYNDQVVTEADKPYAMDKLQAGLVYLMNQYTFRQCPGIAARIVEHLEMLCRHPHISLFPDQNKLYARMINIWRARQMDHVSFHRSHARH